MPTLKKYYFCCVKVPLGNRRVEEDYGEPNRNNKPKMKHFGVIPLFCYRGVAWGDGSWYSRQAIILASPCQLGPDSLKHSPQMYYFCCTKVLFLLRFVPIIKGNLLNFNLKVLFQLHTLKKSTTSVTLKYYFCCG